MGIQQAAHDARPWVRWRRTCAFPFHLAICFVLIASIVAQPGFGSLLRIVWLANGAFLAYLLLSPRRRWFWYLGVGFAALVLGLHQIDANLSANLAESALNTAAVALVALAIRSWAGRLPRFAKPGYLLGYLAIAVVAGPMVFGALFGILAVWMHLPGHHSAMRWATMNAMGAFIATPAFIGMMTRRCRLNFRRKETWLYAALVVAVSLISFTHDRTPVVILIDPLLVLIMIRLDLPSAAIASLIPALLDSWAAARGFGPMAADLAQSGSMALPFPVIIGMAVIYGSSVLLEKHRQTEEKLKLLAERYALVMENLRSCIAITEFSQARNYYSPAIERLTGLPPEYFVYRGIEDVVHPEDRPRLEEARAALRAGSDNAAVEFRLQGSDGQLIWTEDRLHLFSDPKTGKPLGILELIWDISKRKQAQHAADFQYSLIRAIREVSPDGILVVDREDRIVSVSRRFYEIWGLLDLPLERVPLGESQLLRLCADMIQNPDEFLALVQGISSQTDAPEGAQLIELTNGKTLEIFSAELRGEAGELLGRSCFFRDITEHKMTEKRLQEAYITVEALAAADSLTGLANRRRLDSFLNVEWRRAIREGKSISLLVIDVDFFKDYNDSYGHIEGDECLKKIANLVMGEVTRPADLVARFGGDELVVILADTDESGAEQVASNIVASVRRRGLRHKANPHGLVTVSIGCSTIRPRSGDNPPQLFQDADAALYRAKANGRNCVVGGLQVEAPDAPVPL